MDDKARLVFLTLIIPSILITSIRAHHQADPSHQIICNVNTQFQCVCYSGHGREEEDEQKSCLSSIKSAAFPSLRLTLTKFGDLDALRSGRTVALEEGGEVTYEKYFRIHLARIVTRYCVQDLGRCPDVGLAVKPDSVIILRLIPSERHELTIEYALVKSITVHELNSNNAAPPDIVLAATRSQLQSIIPFPISDHRSHTILMEKWRKSAWKENMGLITALIIFACILVIIYIIAIIKAVRDRAKILQRQSIAAESRKGSNHSQKRTTQYGSTDHRPQPLRIVEEEINESAFHVDHETAMDENIQRENGTVVENGPTRKEDPIRMKFSSTTRKIANSCSFPINSSKGKRVKKTNTAYDLILKDINVAGSNGMEDDQLDQREITKSNNSQINYVRIPVLIVPALSKQRNDGDYVDGTVEQSENEDSKYYQNQARSDDSIYCKEEEGSGVGFDNEISDSDDESQAGDELASVTLCDIGYQPLRDSNWSVHKLEPEQYDASVSMNTEYSQVYDEH